MKHVMIDIETMGTRSNSAIASIGAAYFNPATGAVGESFYTRVNLESCSRAGLYVYTDTVMWWYQQAEAAREEVFSANNRQPLSTALDYFRDFLQRTDFELEMYLWGNSARFDLGIMENAYHALDKDVPWKFYNERDVRTLAALAPELKTQFPFEGIEHHALDDALHQIKYTAAIWQLLTKKAPTE